MIPEFERQGREVMEDMMAKSAKEIRANPPQFFEDIDSLLKDHKSLTSMSKEELQEFQCKMFECLSFAHAKHPLLAENNKFLLFILDNPQWFLDEIEEETESNFEIISRVCKKYFEMKKLHENDMVMPFTISQNISNNHESIEQLIAMVGEEISSKILDLIRDSTEKDFDVIFSVLPKSKE